MTTTASYADALRVDRRAATYRQPVPDEVPAVLAAAVTEYRAAYEALDEIEDVLTDVDAQIAAADAADRATVRQAAQDGTLPDLPSTTPARGALVRRMQGAHAQHPDAARRALAAYTALTGAIETHRDTLAADLENRLSELSDLAAPYRRALAAIGHHTERTAELLRWVNDTAARDLAPYRGRPASALPALPAAPMDPSSGGRK